MREYLKRLPREIQDLIYLARQVSVRNNMPAYLVGGFVRDLILGVKNLDLDIVVEGNGIKFAQDFANAQKARLIKHKRFGTATVILKSNQKIDIATARREFYPKPAHLPVVIPGALKEDLFRRDFTINAMAISINGENFGKLIDFFAGKKDLVNKKIRILHDLSFIDDPTRILRAIRFEKRYNFRIEPATLKHLKEAVRLKTIELVQPQRIRDDLILMLKETHPLREIRRLENLVGFKFISQRLAVSKKTYLLLSAIERQIDWFKKTYPLRRPLDIWLMYFMGIIDSLDIKETKAVCRSFVFRRGEEKRLFTFKNIRHRFILGLTREKIKPSRIFNFFEPLSYEVIILLKAKYRNQKIQKVIEDFLEIYNGMRIYISGEDLHKLGVIPGPSYQKIFAQVLNAKLNGIVRTKEEELTLIRKLIKIK